MKNTLQYLFIIIALFATTQNSYSQKSLVARQVDKNTFARRQTDKANVITYLQSRSKSGLVNLYEFNADALQDSVFFLNVIPGETIKVIRQKLIKRGASNYSWHGYIKGADNSLQGSVALVYLNGEISGNLNYRSANYSINPMGKGMFSMYEIDFKRFPKDDAPGNAVSGDKADRSTEAPSAAVMAATCNLRVLVAFTPNAEYYIKNSLGYSSLTQFALEAVAETNQSYINSGVNIHIELAASVRVSYTESGNYDTDLGRFQNTADGYMDEIHTYRNLYAADVNVLIFNNGAACGKAYAIMANAASAFSVVHYECTLGNYSFGHEIAHLQGCRHNPEVDNTNSPFTYGHGYLYIPGGWRTVMAYDFSGQVRLQYFSNPNVTYGGVPMGTTGTHHNARVLNETSGTVNNFRNAASTLTIGSSGAVINDEASDAIATTEVVLQNGFEATGNSEFTARLINCIGPSFVASNDNAEPAGQEQAADISTILAVYPSVTPGPVSISTDHNSLKDAAITVTDNSGRVIIRSINNAGKKIITLNLAPYPNGIYFIQVKQGDKVITRKVIISH